MRILLTLLILLLTGMAGCLQDTASESPVVRTSVFDRNELDFDVIAPFGATLEPGPYKRIGPFEAYVAVDLPMEEGGSALDGSTQVHLAYWMPDVPEGQKVPVFADIGPYYEGSAGAASASYARYFYDTLLPHGYAIAQVSVLGTGKSNHCMDLMGNAEQLGIDAAIEWLGSQEWSNGNVGLFGASYDGSTQWEAAALANPHLKTILPASALIGTYELMWRNGSAENRGPIMHDQVYGDFSRDTGVSQSVDTPRIPTDPGQPISGQIDPTVRYTLDPEDWHNACQDYVSARAHGEAAYLEGGDAAPEYSNYWAERYFLDRTLENYQGSVYLIQGMQDWNVDNHMAFPVHHMLEDAGIEVKGMYGQWPHAFPVSISSMQNQGDGYGGEAFPDSPRLDWQQDVLEWLDYYLYERGEMPALHAEVQSRDGTWRVEESYPPRDADRMEFPVTGDVNTLPASMRFRAAATTVGSGAGGLVFESAPLVEDTHIAGNVYLRGDVTPDRDGGQIFAYLSTEEDGRLGHGILNLRYNDGSKQASELTPGEAIDMSLEFFALDATVKAGQVLRLTLATEGLDYLPTARPAELELANLRLDLPVVNRDGSTTFQPPLWWEIVQKPELDPLSASGFTTGCEFAPVSLPGPTSCIGLHGTPGGASPDGYWIPLEQDHQGRLFQSTASYQGDYVEDTDCYFTDADGEIIGSAFNGGGPCAGRVTNGAEWLYVYGWAQSIDQYEMSFVTDELVRLGSQDK